MNVDFYDLQLFNPLLGDHKWYRIEMPVVWADVETQIALSQLSDRGPTSLLWSEDDEKLRFFFFQK